MPGAYAQCMGGITDVAGVRVAHVTLGEDRTGAGQVVRTGVTCILPHTRDLLADPVTAAVHVVNGYGKPLGLAQVAELGEVEAPIVLTNTLAVGAAHEGVVRRLLSHHPSVGRPSTVNPVVLECNDGRLNDLRALAVRPDDVIRALDLAVAQPEGHPVPEGSVGAGHGMVAFGWKGGIGTSSAVVADDVCGGTLGCLVLTNMGRPGDLVVRGRRAPAPADAGHEGVDGSVIVILATDAPLDSRQLGRQARRAQNGLARTGVATDHGSGEFVLAFTTATPQYRRDGDWLRPWFTAVADVVEDAVLSSLRHAEPVTGRNGLTVERFPAP